MTDKNPETSPISNDTHEMSRRGFAKKLGIGIAVAALGPGAQVKTGEAKMAQTENMAEIVDSLESNSEAYLSRDGEAVDPNIFTGKSTEEQADIITIHGELDGSEESATELLNKINLLFNAGLTDAEAKEVWEEYGTLDAFLPHNTNTNFSRLRDNLFGADFHETLMGSDAIDIRQTNETLENTSKFKNTLDSRFLGGIVNHHTASTTTIAELSSYELVDDLPKVYNDSKLLHLEAEFVNETSGPDDTEAVDVMTYNADMILEVMYDTAESRSMILPRSFNYAVSPESAS